MKNHFRIFQIIILCLYLVIFLVIVQNLGYQYLWFDESVQFWISKGLTPDSEPFSGTGNILNVIESNQNYNMDPGGFGILLHLWSGISNHHIWLRILPFLFFVGVVLSFIYLSYKWHRNLNIALLLGFVPILFPMTLNMGFEVRAYSMETLGALLCVIALNQLKSRMDHKSLFLWSCIFSFFITSRYSFNIVVFVASLYVLYLILKEKTSWKERIFSLMIYSIPLILTLFLIYFFAFVHQNANIKPISYLPYLSDNPMRLLSPINFLYLSCIFICFILFFVRNKYPFLKKYESLLFLTAIVNFLFIILSLMGKHPWLPTSNRCISMVVLMVICFSSFVGELLKIWFKKEGIAKYYIMSFIMIFLFLGRKDNLLPRFKKKMDTYTNFKKVDVSQFNKIYVDRWESPYIKYLFEYGEFKHKIGKVYPDKFTFIKGRPHSYSVDKEISKEKIEIQPTMNDLTDYDLLITPELFNKGNTDKWILIEKTSNFWIKRDK